MEKEIFYEEIDSYISRLKTEFLAFQDLIWDGLVALADICDRNHIPYQLAYGSLLGVIRDKGQIPWDYDIDVFVEYKYRNELISALINELPSRYYVDSLETNANCDSYKIRVVPQQYDAMDAHIDIFLIVPAPESDSLYEKVGKKLILFSKIRRYKTGNEIKYGKNSRLTRLDNFMHMLLYKLIPLSVVDSLYNKTVRKALEINSNFFMLSDRWALTDKIPKKFFVETTTISIGGHNFVIPCDYEKMLERSYKDYSLIFPINQRFEEWYASCKRTQIINRIAISEKNSFRK